MFCEKCGNTLPEGTAFCPNCGAPVKAPSSQTPGSQASAGSAASGRKKPGKWVLAVCGLAVVCVLAVVLVLVKGGSADPGDSLGGKVLERILPSISEAEKWADDEKLKHDITRAGRFQLESETPTTLFGEACNVVVSGEESFESGYMGAALYVSFESEGDLKKFQSKIKKYLSNQLLSGTREKKSEWEGGGNKIEYVVAKVKVDENIFYKIVDLRFDSMQDVAPRNGKSYIRKAARIFINYCDEEYLKDSDIPVPDKSIEAAIVKK